MSWMKKKKNLNNWTICFWNVPLQYQRKYCYYQFQTVSKIFVFSFLLGNFPEVNQQSEQFFLHLDKEKQWVQTCYTLHLPTTICVHPWSVTNFTRRFTFQTPAVKILVSLLPSLTNERFLVRPLNWHCFCREPIMSGSCAVLCKNFFLLIILPIDSLV